MNTIQNNLVESPTGLIPKKIAKKLFRLEVFERKTRDGQKVGYENIIYKDADLTELEIACEQFIKFQTEKYADVMEWECINGLFEQIEEHAQKQDLEEISRCIYKISELNDNDLDGAYFKNGDIEKICEMPIDSDFQYYLDECLIKYPTNTTLLCWRYDVYFYELNVRYVEIEEGGRV